MEQKSNMNTLENLIMFSFSLLFFVLFCSWEEGCKRKSGVATKSQNHNKREVGIIGCSAKKY